MSQWKKVEDEVKKPLKPVDDNIKADTPKGRDNEAETPQPQHKPRHTSGGRRVGRYRMAAPLGFIVLVLAVVGLVSVIVAGIRTVERAMDNTELKEELYEFLLPVMQYDPEPFTDANKTKQDALLLAAIWRVTEAERIRQLVDGSGVSAYPMDDNGRMLISVEEIEESYKYLFGPDAVPYHHTIGDEGKSFTVEYNEEENCYHIPSTSTSLYYTVIDTLKKKKDKIEVRVGYVLSTKVGRDQKGELVEPTPDMAEKFQLYTVRRVGEKGWMLVSIADEGNPGKSAQTTQADEFSETAETTGTTEQQKTQSQTAATTASTKD